MDVQSDRLVRTAIRVWTAIGIALLLVAVWVVLREPLGLILPPVAIAVVVVYVLNPQVTWLEGRRVPRPVGTLLSYVVAAAAIWAALVLVGPVLADQVRDLLEELPGIAESVQTSVNRQLARFGVPPGSRLDLQPEALTEGVRDFMSTNSEQVWGLLRGAGSVVSWVVHVGIAVTLGPILAFYALADLPRLAAGVQRLVPPETRPEFVEVGGRIGRIVGAYFRGQLLVALFVAVATSVGLAAVGLPFWAVVGVTTGVFNLVPLVGPTAGGVFGVLIAVTVGGGVQQALLVVLVMVLVQQVDNHLITPMVHARSVSIHPITVIVSLIVAAALGGMLAMIVAIPAVAIVKLVLLHVTVTRVPSMAHLVDDDDGRPSRRGGVADLARDLRRSFERLAEVTTATRSRATGQQGDDAEAAASGGRGDTAGSGRPDGGRAHADQLDPEDAGDARVDDRSGAGGAGDDRADDDPGSPGGGVSRRAGVAPPR